MKEPFDYKTFDMFDEQLQGRIEAKLEQLTLIKQFCVGKRTDYRQNSLYRKVIRQLGEMGYAYEETDPAEMVTCKEPQWCHAMPRN